tara:strand:- start:1168 stop:1347 length:180 start_codon:yes stop_codon:yes gene_type:complete
MNINLDIDDTKEKRQKYYPFILDQLDALWHDIDDGKLGTDAKTGKWYLACKAVKDKYPK